MKVSGPLERRVEPSADGSYTFRTSPVLSLVVAFLPAMVGGFAALRLWDYYHGEEIPDTPGFLWTVLVICGALCISALVLVRASVTLGEDGITQRGLLRRRRHLAWEDITWVTLAPAVTGGAGEAPLVTAMMKVVSRHSADGWIVSVGDGRGQPMHVSGAHLNHHEHARLVMRRFLREKVDPGLIDDRIGFFRV